MNRTVRSTFRLKWGYAALTVIGLVTAIAVHERSIRKMNQRVAASPYIEPIYGTLFDYNTRWLRTRIFLHRLVGTELIVGLRLRITPNGESLELLKGFSHLYYLELMARDGVADTNADDILKELAGMREFREIREISIRYLAIQEFSIFNSFPELEGVDLSYVGHANWDTLANAKQLRWVNLKPTSSLNLSRDNELLVTRRRRAENSLPSCRIVASRSEDLLSIRLFDHFAPSR